MHCFSISVNDSVFSQFHEDFIFTKLRISEVRKNVTLAKISEFTIIGQGSVKWRSAAYHFPLEIRSYLIDCVFKIHAHACMRNQARIPGLNSSSDSLEAVDIRYTCL